MAALPVRELKRRLTAAGVGLDGCCEKRDLVNLLLTHALAQAQVLIAASSRSLITSLRRADVPHRDCVEKVDLVERILASGMPVPTAAALAALGQQQRSISRASSGGSSGNGGGGDSVAASSAEPSAKRQRRGDD